MQLELKRKLYCVLAFTSLSIGAVGIVVPLLPTTVFVLFAAWAAAKGSPRFHEWIVNNPWFGEPIRRWQRERSVSLEVKRRALLSILISGLIIWLFVPLLWVKLLASLGLFISVLCVWRLPTNSASTESVEKKH